MSRTPRRQGKQLDDKTKLCSCSPPIPSSPSLSISLFLSLTPLHPIVHSRSPPSPSLRPQAHGTRPGRAPTSREDAGRDRADFAQHTTTGGRHQRQEEQPKISWTARRRVIRACVCGCTMTHKTSVDSFGPVRLVVRSRSQMKFVCLES